MRSTTPVCGGANRSDRRVPYQATAAVCDAANHPLSTAGLSGRCSTDVAAASWDDRPERRGFMMSTFRRYCAEKIECSPSFISDCAVSFAYVLVTSFLYVASAHTAPTTEAVI